MSRGTVRLAPRSEGSAARSKGRTSPATEDVDAYSAAVHPNALVTRGSAPFASKTSTTSSCPNCAAHISGVDPFLSFSSTAVSAPPSAPSRRSDLTETTSPHRAARCSGGELRMSVVSRSELNISGETDPTDSPFASSRVRVARDATSGGVRARDRRTHPRLGAHTPAPTSAHLAPATRISATTRVLCYPS